MFEKFKLEKKIVILGKLKNTSAKFWKDLKEGDVLHCSVSVKRYAPDSIVKVTVILNGDESKPFVSSITQVSNALEAFDFKEVSLAIDSDLIESVLND